MDTGTVVATRMSLDEFLSWNPDGDLHWELVEGEPVAMAPAHPTHGIIQGQLARLIINHLMQTASPFTLVVAPGVVPRVRSGFNFRIPDLAVVSTEALSDDGLMVDPVLAIEILSPGNEAHTRANVWSYTTVPTLREIMVIRSDVIAAELLRRDPDGNWPADPKMLSGADTLVLPSIGLTLPLRDAYATTRLASD